MPIEVDTRYGKMLMNIGKKFKEEHARMEFETGFLEIIENEDYDIFIDVGAAWGYFSIPASHHCKRVYAFEPQNSRRDTLKRNVATLKRNNIVVSSKAVGTGSLKLYGNTKPNGMVGPKGRGRSTRAEVQWVSLDEIVFKHKGEKILIKIDVEGFELDVVKSLETTIPKEVFENITFLIERHEFPDVGYSEKELFDFMKPYEGILLGERGQTSHYIFRKGEDK